MLARVHAVLDREAEKYWVYCRLQGVRGSLLSIFGGVTKVLNRWRHATIPEFSLGG